jgi:hypothetical protein
MLFTKWATLQTTTRAQESARRHVEAPRVSRVRFRQRTGSDRECLRDRSDSRLEHHAFVRVPRSIVSHQGIAGLRRTAARPTISRLRDRLRSRRAHRVSVFLASTTSTVLASASIIGSFGFSFTTRASLRVSPLFVQAALPVLPVASPDPASEQHARPHGVCIGPPRSAGTLMGPLAKLKPADSDAS